MMRRVIVVVVCVLFAAFALEAVLPGVVAVTRAEVKVISGAGDRIVPPRTPVTLPRQAARDLRQPAELPTVRSGPTAAMPVPGPTAPKPGDRAGAGGTESSTTATPPPTSPVNTPATPVSAGQPRGSLVGLRRQGITPARLLAGDLLLLIIALIIVIIDRRRRPRER